MKRAPGVILPDDEHNTRLIDNVHPHDWINPEPRSRYHLVVVGAGTAGLVTAAGAAGLGARVALVESHLMGGDCLNVGCVPSKGMISAARGARDNTDAGTDFAVAMSRMRRIRAAISANDSAARFTELGVDVFFGRGRFAGPDAIEVDGKRLRFRRAVIATGARAEAPPIPGLDSVAYLTNEDVFELTTLPKRLAVIGAGPIGCELAQAFRRFGSEVTILDSGLQLLPQEDRDAAAVVATVFSREGVRYMPGIRIAKVERNADGSARIDFDDHGNSEAVDCDAILVAVGRRPNVDDLNLDAVGVATNADGIVVDANMRTANRRVFACGDVASKHKFTHAADAQARIVIQNALFFGRARADKLVMPWCTYTSPEIAHVGLYESDAHAADIAIDTLTIPMSDVDRALLEGQSEGFLRVHTKKGSDKIVGATLVAEHAGDMIGELALAITAGIGLGKIATTIHPYPTQGEIVKKAADAWRRTKLTPSVKRLFVTYFKILR